RAASTAAEAAQQARETAARLLVRRLATRGIRDDLAAAIVQRQRRGTEDFQRGFEHLGTTDTGTDRAVLRHRRRTTPCHHTLANRLAGGLRRARRQRGRRRLHRGGGGSGQHLADIG